MEWISFRNELPPSLTDVLVIKYYIDHEFEEGGYNINKPKILGPYMQIDSYFRANKEWSQGGYITYWMTLPEPPKVLT